MYDEVSISASYSYFHVSSDSPCVLGCLLRRQRNSVDDLGACVCVEPLIRGSCPLVCRTSLMC